MTARNKLAHGQASVSWGPRPFGVDRIIANAPVDAIDDLIEALHQVKAELNKP